MSTTKTVILVVGISIVAWAAVARVPPTGLPSTRRQAEVLVIRDFAELRLTNDSDIDLHNCRVVIDGDMMATLDELPAHGRGALARSAFGKDLPRDEFYRRSRTLDIGCLDDANAFVEITLK